MLQLVIDRSKWLTGSVLKAEKSVTFEGKRPILCGNSMLLRPDTDKMCCLGFLALQQGVDRETVRQGPNGCGDLSELAKEFASYDSETDESYPDQHTINLFKGLIDNRGYNTTLSDRLITVNDDESLTDAAREDRIEELFSEAGIKVIFQGEYQEE